MVKREIWGCETYTSDSDPVCIMKHSGMLNTDEPFPKSYEGVAFYCKVAKGIIIKYKLIYEQYCIMIINDKL